MVNKQIRYLFQYQSNRLLLSKLHQGCFETTCIFKSRMFQNDITDQFTNSEGGWCVEIQRERMWRRGERELVLLRQSSNKESYA